MGTLMSQKHWDLTSEGKDVEVGDSGPSLFSGVEVALVFTRGLSVTSMQPMWKTEEKNKVHFGPTAFSGVSGLMCEAEA